MAVPSEQSLHGPQVVLNEQTVPLHRGTFILVKQQDSPASISADTIDLLVALSHL